MYIPTLDSLVMHERLAPGLPLTWEPYDVAGQPAGGWWLTSADDVPMLVTIESLLIGPITLQYPALEFLSVALLPDNVSAEPVKVAPPPPAVQKVQAEFALPEVDPDAVAIAHAREIRQRARAAQVAPACPRLTQPHRTVP